MKRALAALAVVAMLVAGVSCGTVRSTVATLRALDDAGYDNINVRLNSDSGFDTVVVRASGGPSEDPVGKAAGIVWTTFKLHLDQVDVNIGGQRQLFTRGDLEERFGPRPAGYDKSLARDVARTFAIVGVAVLVVAGIVVVIVVWAVRRGRRKRPPPPPGGWYTGYPPPPGQQPQQWPPPPHPGQAQPPQWPPPPPPPGGSPNLS